ncbi:hypothetical protein NLG97_g8699 [Lecanicillium saksenae]|uniref:Uncharacterized protein n=1 Tax=Lecanicillium saksenae TaxID=468837 RepID=A0ACC1QJY3_9HYPO|nr:hypothetical protein NLG97_g8699 [Lecanicillium saksenae]
MGLSDLAALALQGSAEHSVFYLFATRSPRAPVAEASLSPPKHETESSLPRTATGNSLQFSQSRAGQHPETVPTYRFL